MPQRPWLAHYPDGVPAEIDPHAYPSLPALLDAACQRYAAREACVFMGRAFSYAQLDAAARGFAGWLQSLGLARGARVALMMPNTPAYLVCLLGALRAGCVLVNVNPLYSSEELQHQFEDSEPDVIVVLENFAHVVEQALATAGDARPRHVVVAALGDIPGGLTGCLTNFVVRHVKKLVPRWQIAGAQRLPQVLRRGKTLPFTAPALTHDDLAILQYTGGTTGRPKGACLTHGNLIANLLQVEAVAEPALGAVKQQAMTMMTALPLYHIFALTICALYGLHAGMRLALVPNPRDVDALVAAWKKTRPTIFPAVNTLANVLAHHRGFAALDFSDLRLTLGGGMAVLQSTAEAWLRVTGRPLIEGYGLSETSPVVAVNPTNSDAWSGSIGLPVPGTDVAVLDDAGQPVAQGERGELAVRGPQVMAGYWRNPDETRAAITPDGYFLTGDIAIMDEYGYFRIVDRKKDMIIVSGFNVYPGEIEQIASQHEGVVECAVIGVPDERSGEAVHLYAVRRDEALTEEALLAWLHERITGYKRPRKVVFLPELPKSNVGKILRRELRGAVNAPAEVAPPPAITDAPAFDESLTFAGHIPAGRSATVAPPATAAPTAVTVSPEFSSGSSSNPARLIRYTLVALALLLAWDASGGDAWLARLMGGAEGFPLRDGFWTRDILHRGVRRALWPVAGLLILAIACGWGSFARLPRARRWQLILVPILASGVIATLKFFSQTSCPWALADFGGQAQHVSHWPGWFSNAPDGGPGRCFPAGHASIGFAFIGGWFALRPVAPRLATVWLAVSLCVGLILGVTQQLRGAHFMSHTLWTAWLCWGVGALVDAGVVHRKWRTWFSRLTQPQPAWALVLIACVWMALAGNIALWQRLIELDLHRGAPGIALVIGLAIMLASALVAVTSLFAWRAALKPVITLLLVITALAAHFASAYGVLMTPAMMTNVLQTDTHEALDLFSGALLWRVTWFAALPSLWLARVPVVYPTWRRQLWQQPLWAAGSVAVLLVAAWVIFQPLASAMRNHKDIRYLLNPLAALYSTGVAIARDGAQTAKPLQPIADDVQVTSGARPKLLMLVVGEAARSANFSLNGYDRPTNQALDGVDVISLTNAWSCGTSTAESLPCMFSHLPRNQHIKDKSRHENLLDVLHKAGLAVLWLENQSGCKGVCDRVPTVRTCTDRAACLDTDMLRDLDARIATLDPARVAKGVVLVLHQMGSHGPAYSLRAPPEFKRFAPECETATLAQCQPEHIRNAYDNSIVYTSHVLAQAIAWLQGQATRFDAALLYASDHGESLGENNIYLHGLPYAFAPKEQKHISWLTWAAPTFWPDGEQVLACLAARRDEPVSHDHYFHTVLGMMQARTGVYQAELDMVAACR